MEKPDTGSILILMFVLAFAVVMIDERFLRTAVAVVPALLLMQRALTAGRQQPQRRVGAAERPSNSSVRSAVDELLTHIREFYLTCHMIGSGQISSEEAVERAGELEKKLNRLLARVTDGATAKPMPEATELPYLE